MIKDPRMRELELEDCVQKLEIENDMLKSRNADLERQLVDAKLSANKWAASSGTANAEDMLAKEANGALTKKIIDDAVAIVVESVCLRSLRRNLIDRIQALGGSHARQSSENSPVPEKCYGGTRICEKCHRSNLITEIGADGICATCSEQFRREILRA